MTSYLAFDFYEVRYDVGGYAAFNDTYVTCGFLIDPSQFKLCNGLTCQGDGINPFFRGCTGMCVFSVNCEFKMICGRCPGYNTFCVGGIQSKTKGCGNST